jgi:hypothetical protein
MLMKGKQSGELRLPCQIHDASLLGSCQLNCGLIVALIGGVTLVMSVAVPDSARKLYPRDYKNR